MHVCVYFILVRVCPVCALGYVFARGHAGACAARLSVRFTAGAWWSCLCVRVMQCVIHACVCHAVCMQACVN
jgi:hypothetical protein